MTFGLLLLLLLGLVFPFVLLHAPRLLLLGLLRLF
jgi:hypothetical protein